MWQPLRKRNQTASTMVFCLGVLTAGHGTADTARMAIMAADLLQSGLAPDEPVHNDEFVPCGASAPAHHSSFGALTLTAEEMRLRPSLQYREVMGRDAEMFPGVTL